MFGPNCPRHAAGQHASARRLNAPAALLDRLTNFRMAGGSVWSAAGPMGRGPGTILRVGMTPRDGIPGRDTNGCPAVDVMTADLVVSTDGYSATLSTNDNDTFIGFNLSRNAVAGGALTLYALIQGLWICIWEDCPSS